MRYLRGTCNSSEIQGSSADKNGVINYCVPSFLTIVIPARAISFQVTSNNQFIIPGGGTCPVQPENEAVKGSHQFPTIKK
jgi:hypothetical protein